MTAKKFFYVLLGLLGLAIFAIFGAFYFGNNQLEAQSNKVAEARASLDVTQEKILLLQKSEQDAAEVDSVNELVDRLIPTTKEQDTLIADIIYTATGEAGIPFFKVTAFTFTGGSAPDDLSGTTSSKEFPGVNEYPFSMTINNISFDELLLLLQEVEANGRIVQVDNIQISPNTEGNLSVNLSMKAYLNP